MNGTYIIIQRFESSDYVLHRGACLYSPGNGEKTTVLSYVYY